MKALTCEMCGSTNLIKENSVYICQSCGTKYSTEEAKKLMIDGTVSVEGTVKIDTSAELINLYQIARRAKETDNYENALKYYDMILVKDPNSWEANFYVVYFRAISCKIAEIQNAAILVTNCLETVLQLIKNQIEDKEQQSKAVLDVFLSSSDISEMLFLGAYNHYIKIDGSIRSKYTQEYVYNVSAATNIMYQLGNCIENIFGTYMFLASDSWKQAISQHSKYFHSLKNKELVLKDINAYTEKIKKYDTDFQPPKLSTGCYIATMVYGTYNCPEVWTLRRYRDLILAKTWYGKLFIITYYAISPTLVKWVGDSYRLKLLIRKSLNKLISIQQKKGIESTPYQDSDL